MRETSLVGETGGSEVAPGRVRTTLLGYLALMKPRVIELLLVTTIPAMLLANRGHVDLPLILNTLFGGMVLTGWPRFSTCSPSIRAMSATKTPLSLAKDRATVKIGLPCSCGLKTNPSSIPQGSLRLA
jgi:hypothetical protein